MPSVKKIALATGSALSSLLASAPAVMAEVQVENINPGTGYASNVGTLFNAVLNIVLLIAALLVFGFLIMGGIEWVTSGGDKGKTESARNKLTAAIIGLIIIAASYALVTLAVQFLGFNNINDVFNIGTINNPR